MRVCGLAFFLFGAHIGRIATAFWDQSAPRMSYKNIRLAFLLIWIPGLLRPPFHVVLDCEGLWLSMFCLFGAHAAWNENASVMFHR